MLNNLFKVGRKGKKWQHHLIYDDIINFFLTRKCQKTRKIEVLILNEKISISSEQLEELQWNFQERRDLILKATKRASFHPLSRIYIFGTSCNYCKNLKWKKPFQDFRFFEFGYRANILSQFTFVVSEYKLQQLSNFEVRERFPRYPSFPFWV